MNILIITQLYPQPDDEGENKITRTVEYFAKEWVAMGHVVLVAHCSSRFPFSYYLIPPKMKNKLAQVTGNILPSTQSRKGLQREEFGIKIRRFPMLKLFPGNGYSPKVMAAQAKKISRWMQDKHFTPDLVAGHFANPSAELTAILARQYHAASSLVFHSDCSVVNVKKYRLKENVSQINAVGVRSVIEAGEVKSRLQLEQTPFICYSGVPNDVSQAAKAVCDKHDYADGVHYLVVGSFIRRKYHDVVIRAFLNTSGEKDTLTIIGGGPENDNLRALAGELDTQGKVRFLGRVSRDQVLEEMGKAHIFTLISATETYGMVYIEAMTQGCLTIASSGGGFDGLIQDGKNGFLCAPGNQQELEDIYRKIAAMSASERNAIGQAAIDTAKHFSEREVAERYLQDVMERQ